MSLVDRYVARSWVAGLIWGLSRKYICTGDAAKIPGKQQPYLFCVTTRAERSAKVTYATEGIDDRIHDFVYKHNKLHPC